MTKDDPAAWYRMGGVLNYLNHPEIEVFDVTQERTYTWESFKGATHFIVQRPHTEAHIALMLLAKDLNIRVICDWDDDLFNVPVHRNKQINYTDMKRNLKRCLSISDEVWVTTPVLKTIYKPFNKNIHVIPNCLNDHVFKVEDKKEFNPYGKLATYRGGFSHHLDVQANVNDLYKAISTNKSWEFRFLGAGIPKDLDDLGKGHKTMFELLDERTTGLKNHTFTLPSTLVQFFKLYNQFQAQIAFFPLVTNQFNRSKSEISLIEATYAGSCYMGNRELEQFNHDFVVDISRGMYEPFEAIKDKPTYMRKLNDEAWEWVKSERLLSNINKLREERLLSNE